VLIAMTRGADRLAHALLDRADLELINYHDAVLPYLEARGVKCRRFLDFLSERGKVQASQEAEARTAAVVRELQGDSFWESWGEWAHDPNQRAVLGHAIEDWARRDVFPQIIMIDMLRRCANEADLRLIIVQQDISRDTRTIIEAGHRLGIPALHTLHGYPYGAVSAINLCGSSCADVVAVFSESAKDLFVSLGVPEERIAVTGNFEWDVLARPPRPGFREDMCARLGLDPNRPIITYALSYSHRFSTVSVRHIDYVHKVASTVIDAFGELSTRHPDWQFVFRPHPNDANAPQDVKSRAERAGVGSICIDNVTSALCCVTMTDVLVCCQSNLGIEAVIAGKPVVNCVIDEFAQAVFDEGIGRLYLDENAVVSVRSVDAVAPAIEAALLDDGTRQQFLLRRPDTIRRFNGVNDGKAIDRLCALVLDLVKKGHEHVAPVERWLDLEPAMARAVPDSSGRVVVAGRAARYAADTVASIRPDLTVDVASVLKPSVEARCPVLVLSDPVPHGGEADAVLSTARELLAPDGMLVAAFLHGGAAEAQDALSSGLWAPERSGAESFSPWGHYSRTGVDLALSRCGFEVHSVHPKTRSRPGDDVAAAMSATEGLGGSAAVDAWIVCARPRGKRLGEWGGGRQERRRRAMEANERGERLFAEGSIADAAAAFASAVAECDREAILFNNLGAALYALGRPEEAWRHILTALHFDANLQSARDNLRGVASALGRTEEADHLLRIFGHDSPSDASS
jgi:glycosyltransferase involved in cell wall biosynthesis